LSRRSQATESAKSEGRHRFTIPPVAEAAVNFSIDAVGDLAHRTVAEDEAATVAMGAAESTDERSVVVWERSVDRPAVDVEVDA
jgi:hypothetical protein